MSVFGAFFSMLMLGFPFGFACHGCPQWHEFRSR